MIICNMQKTPKDSSAKMLIRAKIDTLMSALCEELGVTIPNFVLKEEFVLNHSFSPAWTIKAAGKSTYEPPFFIDKIECSINGQGPRQFTLNEEGETLSINLGTSFTGTVKVEYTVHLKDFYKSKPMQVQETITIGTNKSTPYLFEKEFNKDDKPLEPPKKASATIDLLGAIKQFPGIDGLRKVEE
jgi:hypothetical protein